MPAWYICVVDNPMRIRTVRELIDMLATFDAQGHGGMPVTFATTFDDADEGLCHVCAGVLAAVRTSSSVTLITCDDGLDGVCDEVDGPIISAAQGDLMLRADAYYDSL